MSEERYPTLEEFFTRLDKRRVEDDLKAELRARLTREQRGVTRVGKESIVVAVAARMVPGDVPPKALAVFLDDTFDKQLGRGDEKAGMMPRGELAPTGFKLLEEEASRRFGAPFDQLPAERQDELLLEAEKGNIGGPPNFDSATWFKRLRESFLTGFGSDPRGMVQMGFPGPAYHPGHIWLDRGEIEARVKRKKGYMEL